MRSAILLALALSLSWPAAAWERLVTVEGVQIEGDASQQEFVLIDKAGGEVAIPRAAISRFESGEDGLKAFIKDGSIVEGALQGKFEIEDGMIKRRYSASEIRYVEFDRYIVVQRGKEYHSCPIRVELDASESLFGLRRGQGTGTLSGVTCNELQMGLVALSTNGKIKSNKVSTLTAKIKISVPAGEDQRLDLSLTLMQGGTAVTKAHKALTADEGETAVTTLAMKFDGGRLDPAGPKPRLLVQLVSQDAEKQVEKGSFFWWFTFPIPLG